MQGCKSAGTLQDENLQMLWPAPGSSMVKACVDWLCKEREHTKQKDSCTGLLLLEQVNYLSPWLITWHIPFSLLLQQRQISQLLMSSMVCQSAGDQLSATSSSLSNSFFELLSAKQGLPTELLLPKCGIGTKPLNLRCTQCKPPAFPPPGKCAAIVFINNISYNTLAFSLENSSLDIQVGLNLSTHINTIASAHSFLPESNLFRLVGILAGTSQPQSHGAAALTNPSREQTTGGIPELQEATCLSWASNQSLGATECVAWCVHSEICCSHNLLMFPRQLCRRDRAE